jgi:precorrin-4/cobalt-precorrin-4 C11-methyltransferase
MRHTTLQIVAVTRHGVALAQRLAETWGDAVKIFVPAQDMPTPSLNGTVERYDGTACQQVGVLLREGAPLAVVASVGETVLLLAPYLQREASYPPVIAVEPEGRFVVPLVQGVQGGGDTLAARIAALLGAMPVISRSLVVGIGAEKGVPAEDFEAAVCDVLQGFGMAPGNVKTVATLDRRAAEQGLQDWATQRGWPVLAYTAEQLAEIQEMPTPSAIVAQAVGTPGVCEPAAMLASGSRTLLVPKQKRGRVTVAVAQFTDSCSPLPPYPIPMQGIDARIKGTLQAGDRPSSPLDGGRLGWGGTPTAHPPPVSSPTRGEKGDREVSPDLSTPHPVPIPLEGEDISGPTRQQRPDGTTLPRGVGQARIEGGERTQTGRLSVVGIGPGAADLLTVRAVNAIDMAEVLVGYTGYLQLLGDRVAGKELHGSAIGREIDRVCLAIDLAHRGRRVALISSGDAGIYGMAGQVFEALHAQGRTSDSALAVEVIPGITAAQAAASLLGAPLANDFAVLSLSDLLKARETVEGRLEALAAADIVLAFYNPQSQKRRELFHRACEILLRYRHASTPVAVVKAAYREGQNVQMGDLGHLADMAVDMESLVLVGNSQTGAFAGHMVTARGQGTFAAAAPDRERRPEEPSDANLSPEQPSHSVLFVGAGPGDAELLTLKGARALASADVVVYAGSLVPRGVLQHVRPGARLHNSATLTLEETHRLLAEAYRAGQQVVRLHSGDPSIYGAITEQMALLDGEHIPYEIVPGVSAFQAVAARLGIEYTQPGVVQTVILTRPGGRTGVPENESLEALARHGVTLCVFLGARHVVEVQRALLTSYPPTTPVAVAYRATWPDEELTTGTLADLVEMVRGPEYDRTTLIIVGPSLQRQGKRSHLYDPTYQHLFRPGKRRGSGTVQESRE